jgi:dTDP-glucose 4,6-dehydratase
MTGDGQPKTWSGRRVLVTGANGFIGSRLSRQLVEAGAAVWAGIFPDEIPECIHELPSNVTRIPLDMREPESVKVAVSRCRPDIVFHLAAVGVTTPNIDPRLAMWTNTGGAIALLGALSARAVERVVLVGTSYEYGARSATEGLDPFNFYAASKAAAWAFGRAFWRVHGLPVIFARPFQVYGPRQSPRNLIPAAIQAALAGDDFRMTPGEQARDFIFVEDVVEGLLASATAPGIEGESVDLGTGTTCSIYTAVRAIWAMTDAQGEILTGALPYRPAEVMQLGADADRTARLIGWRAGTPLEEGLRRTIAASQAAHIPKEMSYEHEI